MADERHCAGGGCGAAGEALGNAVDGRDVECRLERGAAQMQMAASHVVQNLGGQPVELISIELKRKPAAR